MLAGGRLERVPSIDQINLNFIGFLRGTWLNLQDGRPLEWFPPATGIHDSAT